ncbi:glycosyl transferase [Lysobacter concretionis Ko07 = DSM 16239]|uniref:Glycosyl transferase n=1 Tax=Lysobacter concretionis Ko07 = DSM 16239 TaxID=1122185 RepID=A0A0A0ES53_9GAMM|nr:MULTISPECIES: glycosyltransferase [Lysobacter]KGM52948.1 glycosyl transferase [Lysobacter concretionis Ko07 = DSM 16239]QOD91386.1 glycosyltransferase [Lysobacter sp. CW239]
MQPVLSALPPSLAVVIPIYRNEDSLDDLLLALEHIRQSVEGAFEAIFVVDGSPDRSHVLLREKLPNCAFPAQLVALTRNFGAFPAIRTGLEMSRSDITAVMAADLQEPPELVIGFYERFIAMHYDVAFGLREARKDPMSSKLASTAFWAIYRRMVIKDIPKGGVDIFAVSKEFRERLMLLNEAHSSLLAQLFWLGGKREFVSYQRRERPHGKSAWTLSKKLRYLSDSVFAFTDLPVRMLTALGLVSLAFTVLLGFLVLAAKLSGLVHVPGYAGTILTILFFGAFNSLGLGIVGTYAWHAFENTKARPLSIKQSVEFFEKEIK